MELFTGLLFCHGWLLGRKNCNELAFLLVLLLLLAFGFKSLVRGFTIFL